MVREDELFGELRSMLQAGAGTARGWGRLCELVEGFEPERFSAQVLPYVLAHRDRFPEHLRFIPRRWLQDEALWPLARIADALLVDLESAAWAAQYLAQQHEPHTTLLIVHLPLDDKIDDEAFKRALGVELSGAPGLAAVRRLYILPGKWSGASALSALLRSPHLASLEEVVARGLAWGEWLPDALVNHPKLRFVDLSARTTVKVGLPLSVESLALQHGNGDLIDCQAWFGAAAPPLKQLWLKEGCAKTLAGMVKEVYLRLTALAQLEVPTTALLTMLAHKPLAQAWATGLKTLEVIDRHHVITADEAERLSRLHALERFTSARFERWQDVVTFVASAPNLRHLSLRGTWCVELVRALEANDLSQHLSVLQMSQMEQEQLDALYAMDPAKWPRLSGLTLGWDIQGELDLSRVAILSQLESLNIHTTETSAILEGSLSAAMSQGRLSQLLAISLNLPMSEELGAQVCSATWPKLKALALDCEVCDELLALVVNNPSLQSLRWLDFEEPENFLELDALEAQLVELFQSEALPALEYIALEDRLLERALKRSASRSEWLLTNRMMFWFYRSNPERLGLADLFGAF